MFNGSFFERGCDIIPVINQSDLNGTTVTGDWIKLRDYMRVGVLMAKYGSEDVDDTGLQLLQATDAAGTSSKALSLPANGLIMTKTGTLTSATVWTRTLASAAIDGMAFGSAVPTGFTRVIADVNTSPLLLYAEFETTALDADNNFDWFTAYFGNNVNNACLVSVWAILLDGKYKGAVPLSAIS